MAQKKGVKTEAAAENKQLFACLSAHLSICTPVRLHTCPSVHLPVCTPVRLHTCLSEASQQSSRADSLKNMHVVFLKLFTMV